MSWDNFERRVDRGPMSAFAAIFVPFLLIAVIVGGVGYVFGWFGEAASVVKEEFGPRAALEKYEWFVDTAADIRKMDRDVELFKKRLSTAEKECGGKEVEVPMPVVVMCTDRVAQARDDLLAVTSQRNGIVREYNAASAKFNWALFQTRPDKPQAQFFILR